MTPAHPFYLDLEAQEEAAREIRRLLAARAPVLPCPRFEHPVADLWCAVAWLFAYAIAHAAWPAAESWALGAACVFVGSCLADVLRHGFRLAWWRWERRTRSNAEL
jgi:hypothetical protein